MEKSSQLILLFLILLLISLFFKGEENFFFIPLEIFQSPYRNCRQSEETQEEEEKTKRVFSSLDFFCRRHEKKIMSHGLDIHVALLSNVCRINTQISARAFDRSQITLPGKSQRQFAYYYYRSRKRYWEGKTYDTWVVTETRTSVLFDGVENPIYICRVFHYIRQSVTKEERNETKRNPRG